MASSVPKNEDLSKDLEGPKNEDVTKDLEGPKNEDVSNDLGPKNEVVSKDLEGPNSKYVKLISSDEHEFIVEREHALVSGTIKAMLSGPGQFAENQTNEIKFREIPSHILSKVCEYLVYKVKYTESKEPIPIFDIPVEICLELLMAANFLDC